MLCQKCSSNNEPNALFCTSCGNKLTAANQSNDHVAPVSSIKPVPPRQNQGPIPPVMRPSAKVTPAEPSQAVPQQQLHPSATNTQYQSTNHYAVDNSQVVSFGHFMYIILLIMIPLINIILLIKWSISHKNRTIKNFARALIVWNLIGATIGVAFFMTNPTLQQMYFH